tara:strand:- start:2614 stop:3045 length:432 start_codon:yes stop_codon:yes gene_type:complete
MKYLILIVVFNLLATTCAKNKKCEVTLQSASWLNWFGGIPNVGGTDYSFKFLTNECEDLKIDSVFIDGQSLRFKVKRTENVWDITASKNIKPSSGNRNKIMSKPTTTTIAPPPMAARMVYSTNNRSSAIIIDYFTQGKDQFRQ